MEPTTSRSDGVGTQLVRVRPGPAGQFTAEAVGLPELRASAGSRKEALREVRARLAAWLASGELVPVAVASPNPVMEWFGRADPRDPDERAYLAELARLRQDDLDRTPREGGAACPGPSSTPTT